MKRVRSQPDEIKLSITPLIDVTFLLLIFFMCAMKFKTLDRKVEAWLPKTHGLIDDYTRPPDRRPVSVALRRDTLESPTRVVLFGETVGVGGDGFRRLDEKLRRIGELRVDDPPPGDIDAGPRVPHMDVMRGLDSLLLAGVEDVTFRGAKWPADVDMR